MNDLLRGRLLAQSGVVTAREAHTCGYTSVSLSRLVSSGHLCRVRAGCYVDARLFIDASSQTDAALFAGQITKDDLEVALRIARLGPGRADARATLELADGLAESPGESWARVLFVSMRLPTVESQVEIRTAGGRFVGRVDFLFFADTEPSSSSTAWSSMAVRPVVRR